MIHARGVKITSVVVSIFILYWMTSLAYQAVKKPLEVENLPLIMKSPCSIEHSIVKKSSDMTDISLYHGGIKEEKIPDIVIKNQLAEEAKIQAQLLEIVKDEVQKVETDQEKAIAFNKPIVEKNNIKAVKPKNDKNDAFSKKKSSVFDLAGE